MELPDWHKRSYLIIYDATILIRLAFLVCSWLPCLPSVFSVLVCSFLVHVVFLDSSLAAVAVTSAYHAEYLCLNPRCPYLRTIAIVDRIYVRSSACLHANCYLLETNFVVCIAVQDVCSKDAHDACA